MRHGRKFGLRLDVEARYVTESTDDVAECEYLLASGEDIERFVEKVRRR